MPGIKHTIYDGSVCVDGGTLDLRGYIDVLTSAAHAKGDATIAVDDGNGGGITALSEGDVIRKALTGEVIGKVKSCTTSVITLYEGAKVPLADNSVIEKYPKFEIVAIQVTQVIVLADGNYNISNGNDISSDCLVPTTSKWAGSAKPDGTAFAVSAEEDFGAKNASEGSNIATASLPAGVTLEGRWKYIQLNSGDSCICYLKATPSVGI